MSAAIVLYDTRIELKDWQGENVKLCAELTNNLRGVSGFLHLLRINRDYADKHGYKLLYYSTTKYDESMPPYWSKAMLLRDALEMMDDAGKHTYEHVMWLDSDACVHPPAHTLSIADFWQQYQVDDETFFLYTSDPPRWRSSFLAGVFVIKNTAKARDFMREWTDVYQTVKHLWRRAKTKLGGGNGCGWECFSAWAGPAYEQGAGAKLLLSDTWKPFVRCIPWEVLQNYNDFDAKTTFCMHFPWTFKALIPHYLSDYRPDAVAKPTSLLKKSPPPLLFDDTNNAKAFVLTRDIQRTSHDETATHRIDVPDDQQCVSLVNRTQKYALQHGHRLFSIAPNAVMEHAWQPVAATLALLESAEKPDWVAWIEPAATVHVRHLSITALFDELTAGKRNKNLFFACGPDYPWIESWDNQYPLSMGFWIVRNCVQARAFFKSWLRGYDPAEKMGAGFHSSCNRDDCARAQGVKQLYLCPPGSLATAPADELCSMNVWNSAAKVMQFHKVESLIPYYEREYPMSPAETHRVQKDVAAVAGSVAGWLVFHYLAAPEFVASTVEEAMIACRSEAWCKSIPAVDWTCILRNVCEFL